MMMIDTYRRAKRYSMLKKIALGMLLVLAIMNLPDMVRYAKIEMM
jgi:hypothetical protein